MDMDAVAVAVLTFFTILASFLWLNLISKKRIEPSIPPGPIGVPILGYLPFLHSNLHTQLEQLAQKYGPIFKIWLGSKLCVVISSPSLIKEVVRDHDINFASRDSPIAAILATGGGIDITWSPYGSHWRALRKLFVKEMLSNNSLEASYAIRRQEIQNVVRKVCAKIGGKLNVGELIFASEMNVTTNLLWGGGVIHDKENNDRLGVEFREVVSKLVDIIGKPNVSDFFPLLAKLDIQGIEKETKRIVTRMDKIFDSAINERMNKMSESGWGEYLRDDRKKDFLQILLELKELEDPQTSIDLIQIKTILLDVVVGGTDTTSTTIEWAMSEILSNPHVMERVQQELGDVVGMNNTPEESHISKLHYLDAVVKETFRLHLPVPLLVPKNTSESCTVGGYTVPKGSRVLLNVWSVQRDPQIWENPSEFKPERFLDEPEKYDYTGNNFNFLPFGSGRRVCPGIPLGERMVMHLLATLFHLFDWKVPQGEKLDLSEQFGIVMRKKTPLLAIPSHQRLLDVNLYV